MAPKKQSGYVSENDDNHDENIQEQTPEMTEGNQEQVSELDEAENDQLNQMLLADLAMQDMSGSSSDDLNQLVVRMQKLRLSIDNQLGNVKQELSDRASIAKREATIQRNKAKAEAKSKQTRELKAKEERISVVFMNVRFSVVIEQGMPIGEVRRQILRAINKWLKKMGSKTINKEASKKMSVIAGEKDITEVPRTEFKAYKIDVQNTVLNVSIPQSFLKNVVMPPTPVDVQQDDDDDSDNEDEGDDEDDA